MTPGAVLKLRVGKAAAEVVEINGNDREEVNAGAVSGRNTARQYEAFLQGEEGRDRFPDFRDAVRTHKALDWIRNEAGW
jgi:hypothetical protein